MPSVVKAQYYFLYRYPMFTLCKIKNTAQFRVVGGGVAERRCIRHILLVLAALIVFSEVYKLSS